MKTHYLKTVNPFFKSVWEGAKKFECRFNDRDFQPGDNVVLQEYLPDLNEYTGFEIHGYIDYILKDFVGLADGYVVFTFIEIDRLYK